MRFDYRIIFIISALLFTLSTSLTVINYIKSVDETRKQLKNNSLPLSVDSIYSKIQKQLIEPNLIASMMSHDTFMKDWLVNEESDIEKITQYLAMIKTQYKMFTTFLVSEESRNYYTDQGMLEKISSDNKNNAWYFKFRNSADENEINIDYNDFMGQSLIMFINHKIYDGEFNMVGATGIGLKTSYINNMLKKFREHYDFNVFFIDNSGNILISETGLNDTEQYRNHEELQKLMPKLINNEKPIYEYKESGESYLLTKKYIAELDLSLVVMAKVDNFTRSVKDSFYFNMVISLIITILIAFIVVLYVKKIHEKLQVLAKNDALTGLANRLDFNSVLEKSLSLITRKLENSSLIFIDIDNFKRFNEEKGHDAGDKFLLNIANVLKSATSSTDYVARWGDEEFIALLNDTSLDKAKIIAEQIKEQVEKDDGCINEVKSNVTISLVLIDVKETDNQNEIFKRVNKALNKAKKEENNRVSCPENKQ